MPAGAGWIAWPQDSPEGDMSGTEGGNLHVFLTADICTLTTGFRDPRNLPCIISDNCLLPPGDFCRLQTQPFLYCLLTTANRRLDLRAVRQVVPGDFSLLGEKARSWRPRAC